VPGDDDELDREHEIAARSAPHCIAIAPKQEQVPGHELHDEVDGDDICEVSRLAVLADVQSVTSLAGVVLSLSPPGTRSSSSPGRQSVPVPRIAPLPLPFGLGVLVGEGAGAPFG